jgi:hypothetical protein
MATDEKLAALEAALIKADAAGNTDDAKALASHIRALKAAPPAASPKAPAAAPVAQKVAAAPPAEEGTSFLGGLGNLAYGGAKGLADGVQGAGQLVLNSADALLKKFPMENGKVGAGSRFISEKAQQFNEHLKAQEADYQQGTRGSWAAGTGRVAASVAPFLVGGEAARAPEAIGWTQKLAAGLRATGGAAVQGAGLGAIQPVFNGGAPTLESVMTEKDPSSYWNEKTKQMALGAALGGGLNRVGAGVGAVGKAAMNTVRPLVSPGSTVGDMLAAGLKRVRTQAPGQPEGDLGGLLGADANPQAVIERLRAAGQLVPGSNPTTAQVAGIPQLVMAEKVLRSNPASAEGFVERGISNNAARMQALRSVAQTPEALAAAIKARGEASKPLYDAFGKEVMPLDDSLSGLLNTPIGKDAIARARALAANKQQPFGMEAAVPEQSVPSAILGPDGLPMFTTVIPGKPGSINGEAANQIKMSMDAMQRDVPMAGVASHEAGALRDVRGQLVSQLDAKSPTFQQARDAWAQGSVPVNTMEAGQSILNGVSGLGHNVENEVAPMLSQYRTQLAKALKDAKYGIQPEAQASLEAIQRDMQREAISNSIRQPGSDTFFNAQAPNWLAGKLFGQGLDGKGFIPKALGATGGYLTGGPVGAYGGKVAAEKLGAFVGNRVNREFQEAMLDPNHFAKLLAQALDRQNAATSPALKALTPAGTKAAQLNMEDLLSPSP